MRAAQVSQAQNNRKVEERIYQKKYVKRTVSGCKPSSIILASRRFTRKDPRVPMVKLAAKVLKILPSVDGNKF